MNNYEKKFHSTCGGEFLADVYSVLVAFEVDCPARQHAIKKLLMPGQRGAKSEVQDLKEALASVSRAIDMVRARLPEGGTLTGDTEPEPEPKPEPKPEPEPKPKLVTWRRCVRIEPTEIYCGALWVKWHPSGHIPEHWYPIEAQSQPIETVQQLPEGQEPRVEANMIFVSLCGWTKADGNGLQETCRGGTLTGETEAEPEPEGENRLYIWHEFAPDYRHGLAVAIASSEAEARRLVVKHLRFSPDDWGPLTTCTLNATATAWAVTGGQ